MTFTSGSVDNALAVNGNVTGDNTITLDYGTIVSDNKTSDSNMRIRVISKTNGLTITNNGAIVTYTGNDGTQTYTATFVFVDEAGNESVSVTQEIKNI